MKRIIIILMIFVLSFSLSSHNVFAIPPSGHVTERLTCILKDPNGDELASNTETYEYDIHNNVNITHEHSCVIDNVENWCPYRGAYTLEVWSESTCDSSYSEFTNKFTWSNRLLDSKNIYNATCARNGVYGTPESKDQFYCDGDSCYECKCTHYEPVDLYCDDGTSYGECSSVPNNRGKKCEYEAGVGLKLVDRCRECGECPTGLKCIYGPTDIVYSEDFSFFSETSPITAGGDQSYLEVNIGKYVSAPSSLFIHKTNEDGYSGVVIATENVSLEQGETYSVSAYVSANVRRTVRLIVFLSDWALLDYIENKPLSPDTYVASSYNTIIESDNLGWQKLRVDFVAPPESPWIVIDVRNASEVYVDDVVVAKYKYGCTRACIDNTLLDECSDSPSYVGYKCIDGALTPACRECGCPDGYRCNQETQECEEIMCSDGTLPGECSSNTPGMYCQLNDAGDGADLISGYDFGCPCPDGNVWVSMPSVLVFNYSFEEDEGGSIGYFSNFEGSEGSGGWDCSFSHSGYCLYGIEKINNNGYSVNMIPIDVDPNEEYMVSVWVATDEGNFARIRGVECIGSSCNWDSGPVSEYHSGNSAWEKLSYTFSSSGSTYYVVLEVKNSGGVAYFDDIEVKKYGMMCTGTCWDGTPVGHCSNKTSNPDAYGQPFYCEIAGERPVPRSDICGCPGIQEPQPDGTCALPSINCYSHSKIGDADNNGDIDQHDADLIGYAVDGLIEIPENICCVDVNADGNVDITDKTLIENFLSGLDDTGFVNLTCSDLICSDETPAGQCSQSQIGKMCIMSNEVPTLVDKCSLCGCPEGYGCNATTETCEPCEALVGEPEMTIGEERCIDTGGELVIINDTEYGCPIDYICECPSGTMYDENAGCIVTCNNNNVCEPWESKATCPNDCPVEFRNVRVEIVNNPPGLRFYGDIDLGLLELNKEIRVCSGDATISECLNENNLGINRKALCKWRWGTNCMVECSDKEGTFYLVARSSDKTIASDYYNYTCPQLGLDELEFYHRSFGEIHHSVSLMYLQALDCKEHPNKTYEDGTCRVYDDVNATIDYWINESHKYREARMISAQHFEYLSNVLDNPTVEKIQEAFNKTLIAYNKLEEIIEGGTFTTISIRGVSTGSSLINRNATIFVNVERYGNPRYGFVACKVVDPDNTEYYVNTSCQEISSGTFELPIFVDKQGTWWVQICWVNASIHENCAMAGQYDNYTVPQSIEVYGQMRNIEIASVSVPYAVQVGTKLPISVNVNPSNVLLYGIAKCVVEYKGEERTVNSQCERIEGETELKAELHTDETGSGTVKYCYIEASENPDCSDLTLHDNYTVEHIFNVTTEPPKLSIREVVVPSRVNLDEDLILNAFVFNPTVDDKYVFLRCRFVNPQGEPMYENSECIAVPSGDESEVRLVKSVDKLGIWSVTKCELNVSSESSCANSEIHDEDTTQRSFTVPAMAIVEIDTQRYLTIGETLNINVKVKNYAAQTYEAFVNCTVIDPSNIRHRLKSENKTISGGEETIFTLDMLVSKEGVWQISECKLFRYGSIILEDEETGGNVTVGQLLYCDASTDCPGNDFSCYCENNTCQPCPENKFCSDHQCVEPQSVFFEYPTSNSTIRGEKTIIVNTTGNSSGVVFSYSSQSSKCEDSSQWLPMTPNPQDNTYVYIFNTTSLNDGVYYMCAKAEFFPNNEILSISIENVEIDNYGFRFEPISYQGQTNPGNYTDYKAILENIGVFKDRYQLALSVSPNWTATLWVNGTNLSSIELNPGESVNVTVRLQSPETSKKDDVGYVDITVTNGIDESTTQRFTTTIVEIPNTPPVIKTGSVYHRPEKVREGNYVTFYANITDVEGDEITAKVCADANCSTVYCTMTAQDDVYYCDAVVSGIGEHTYYLNVTDSRNASTLSAERTFIVVSSNYCESDNDCPTGYKCNQNNECEEIRDNCHSDSDCPADRPICDMDTRNCVECLRNEDCKGTLDSCFCHNKMCKPCPSGFECSNYKCVSRCYSNNDCSGSTPICDIDTGNCVECLSDSDCSSGERCVDKKCVEGGGIDIIYIVVVIIIVVIIGIVYYKYLKEGKEEEILQRIRRERGW